ncbi:MAG: carboxypeptidase regulatory-like domain-containing protein [Gammaproteobacteria bacterium]|nr:carboxypeptidase regulatory-like domain-containing protein [Gammaproteobacteria bacterium]
MNQRRWVTLALFCLFAVQVHSAAAAKYKVLKDGVADGGTLSGQITYDGTPPAPEVVVVDEDVEACGGAERKAEDLLVSGSGGIQNVVVSITDVKAGKQWDFGGEFTYDQKTCRFIPRILLIEPKSSGVVLNSDSIGHNFHTVSKGIFNVNKKIQGNSEMAVQKNKIRKSGMIRAKCDIHSWMGGYWVVPENPYATLSDADGQFSITDIPAGTYTVKIWHEKLGESTQEVVVKPGETTEMKASLKL